MSLFSHYLRLLLFACGLLIGVQIPTFLDQYAKRVDAHLSEARQNLGTFQQDADKYFGGDIQRLIAHYAKQADPVFQDGSASVTAIHDRVVLLERESLALARPWYAAAYHVLFHHNEKILNETIGRYSYAVLLNLHAAFIGLFSGFGFALFGDLAMGLVRRLGSLSVSGARRRHARA